MTFSRTAFDADICPVDDDVLGSLYRASAEGLPALIRSVPPASRALLALFCYRRAHLHEMALVIASSCEERDLSRFGGTLGLALFAMSRDAAPKAAAPVANRRTITLSTKPLREFSPLDEPENADVALPARQSEFV